MSSYWVMGVIASGHPKPQSSGVPYLTVFGVVGTLVGIAAAIQQFSSTIRRRRYQGAEEKLLRAIESNEAINESLSKMEQYERVKASLRNEIETQIPKQARIAYLTNRLEQVTDDLHRNYSEYEAIRKELKENQEASGLDQSIRDAVAASTPARRMQESRIFYMLSLAVLLLVFSISPVGPSSYFRIVANSIEYDIVTLIVVMLSGTVFLIPVWLLGLSFVPNGSGILPRFLRLRPIAKMALLACPILVSAAGVAAGFTLWDRAAYESYVLGQNAYDLVSYAELSFNVAVIAFSIGIAVLTSLRQRKVWQGQIGLRRANRHTR